MPRKLDEYDRKRDFTATPSPAARRAESEERRFVIQQHHAPRLHWDLRLEHDGVLLSWALPRGPLGPRAQPPRRPHRGPPVGVPRLRGRHPGRQLRRGQMTVWDHGAYQPEKIADDKWS